ncbi:MAG: fused MFS/spermidine synthase, partial [Acidobacteria bacterium]|nr:fused MFS/spermidine synthase [Acidobacteriota bacterium]
MRSGAPARGAAADLRIARAVLFFSGFAGLGYEMLWTRMLSTALGHEISAVLAVVAAFFCGCALGSWALDGPVRRSLDPVRWYAWIEVVIGVWSVALSALLPLVVATAAGVIGAEPGALRQWAASFGISFLALAPATIAMGATLPAIERIVTGRNAVGTLYAANTLGAVAGLMATTYALIPALGQTATSWVLAAANLVCAGAALALLRGRSRTTAAPAASRPDPAALSSLRLGTTAFLAGLLGIGFEVLVTRVLGQVLENTVYSFSSVLAVFLVGTALGAALAGRLTRGQAAAAAVRRLLVATSAACLLGVAILPSAGGVYRRVQAAAGGGQAAAIGAEIVVATLVLLLPTMAMGATFSVLAQRAVHGGLGLGRLLAANTLGASLAPALFGVALLPAFGSRTALLLTSAGYLTLVPEWRGRAWRGALAPAALAVLVLAGPGTGHMVTLEPGDRLLDHREGVMASVSVVEDARGERHLKVNDRFQMGGTTSFYSDVREAEIPLLLHSDPRRALFLGLGAGVTFAAAAQHPELEAVGVELLPEVVGVLPRFEKVTGDLARAPNLRIVVADARRYVLATPERFDVVVGDLFHPSRDGAGALYTVEHFEAVRRRLRPGGLFCQWLPLYQLDLEVLRTIVRSFRQVFPEARLHLAHYSLEAPIVGLIGFEGDAPAYSADWLESRAQSARWRAQLDAVRLGT